MSYLFDDNNHRMNGTFTDDYAAPITLACHIKIANMLAFVQYLVTLHTDGTSIDFEALIIGAALDRYLGITFDTAGNQATINETDGTHDDNWLPIVYKSVNATDRSIYVNTFANSNNDTNSRDAGSLLNLITLGESSSAISDFTAGLMAEIAMWDVALSEADITSYLAGNAASGINASNLIGYWPLDTDNSTQTNEGVDTAGDLTVTAATFDADHPIITGNVTAHQIQAYQGMNRMSGGFRE